MVDPERGKIVVRPDPDVADLVPPFLDTRKKEVGELTESLARKDFDHISVIAHRMAGLAGGYGFDGLTDIARELEHAAGKKNETQIRHCVNMIAAYLDKVVVEY